MRNNPDFENNRINRWVKKIQKFYLMIEYREGEGRVVIDALIRVFTHEEQEKRR
jgi:hypothetical protein